MSPARKRVQFLLLRSAQEETLLLSNSSKVNPFMRFLHSKTRNEFHKSITESIANFFAGRKALGEAPQGRIIDTMIAWCRPRFLQEKKPFRRIGRHSPTGKEMLFEFFYVTLKVLRLLLIFFVLFQLWEAAGMIEHKCK